MPVFFLLPAFFFSLYCYLPALHGPFVLDDEPNFYGLRFVDDIEGALAYSYNGIAGKRWISYLSFTLPVELDAWKQGNAFSFKLINLIIHGINSLLVFGCLRQLFILKNSRLTESTLLALAISAFWAMHPIHANTVLYSVQRMTLLSSTAVLAGLYYHLTVIKTADYRATTVSHWLIYTFIVWLITALGILCKESAVLLPLYLLVCFAFIPQRPFTRLQCTITLLLPYFMLIAYLIISGRLGFGNRNFTMTERLLSEVVIMKDYVLKIALPDFNAFSLFNDDFKPVKTLTDMRFLMSSLFWLVFIAIAKLTDKWAPGVWFGCLWFLAGHTLESTVIPLELVFDHRNYLPALGILVMAASLLISAFRTVKPGIITGLLLALIIAFTGKYLWVLKEETGHWHNKKTLSASLIEKHPDSMRATQYYIENLVSEGQYKQAIQMINYIYAKFGVGAANAIFQVGLSCLAQPLAPINHEALINDLKTLPADMAVSDAMNFLYTLTKDGACPSLNLEMYQRYTDSLLSNPRQHKHYHNLVFLLVFSHIQKQDYTAALSSSFRLAKYQHSPQFLFLQMRLSLHNGDKAAAESIYAEISAFDKPQKMLYKDEIEKIQLALTRLRDDRKN